MHVHNDRAHLGTHVLRGPTGPVQLPVAESPSVDVEHAGERAVAPPGGVGPGRRSRGRRSGARRRRPGAVGTQPWYELKAHVEESVGYYWPIPHAQLYRDPPRLAERGLLEERAEEHGRRRRVFHLTDAGHEVLARWLADPATPPPETRNPAPLKLAFVGLGPSDQARPLARTQADQHRGWLETYRKLRVEIALGAPDSWLARVCSTSESGTNRATRISGRHWQTRATAHIPWRPRTSQDTCAGGTRCVRSPWC
jgi:DNA-binding PadR family transcriptional regulator